MNISQLLSGGFADALGWALVHSVWQGVGVAMLLAIILRLMRGTGASARCLAGCIALVMIVAGFVGTILFYLPRERPIELSPSLIAPAPSMGPIALDVIQPAAPVIESHFTAEIALPWLVAGWMVGVLALSLWQFGGWMLLRRYRRMAGPISDEWLHRLMRLAGSMGVKRVQLRLTERLDVPIVIGLLRPTILLPVAILANLPVAQIEAILAHELAHIRRNDYLINLIQSAIETIFFYHPAVWWISKQIRKEREFACDEIAAKHCGDRATYAKALAALEESRVVKLAPAAGGGGRGELVERVRRVLGHPAAARAMVRRPRSWAVVAIVLAGCAAITMCSRPLVAQQGPTTAPSRPAIAASPAPEGSGSTVVEPADLIVVKADYRIIPNDLLQVTIGGLAANGADAVKSARVSESGNINLPLLDLLHAAGLTEAELEKSINTAYRDKSLIVDARSSVAVLEARGRIFTIAGAVRHQGQYAIVDSGMRLFDALAMAQGTTGSANIRIIRPTGDPAKPRMIEIPGAEVAAGNPKINLVIRPGDTIVAVQPEAASAPPTREQSLQKLLDENVAAQQSAWDELQKRAQAGEALTVSFLQVQIDTAKRICEAQIAAATDSAGKIAAAREYLVRCNDLVGLLRKRLGQDVTAVQMSQAISMVADAKLRLANLESQGSENGVYYLGGKIRRSGVYSLSAHDITLRSAVIAGGGPSEESANFITIIRSSGGVQAFVLRDEPLSEIMAGRSPDVLLKADDQIIVSDFADQARPATLPAVR